ncbi:hypothetical protein OSB04_013323 [Centaurea solstitialis]|uniref:Uncharacterized protein n=1 Tax=Centaurea solstitialis TaxID=347529 RepID=A0AA38WQJ5_9ASTR|nr:hypothetical protein OSB04_013323 [Centaurea solstitialis]
MFRVKKHWTKRLQDWKHNHVTSHILGQCCRKVFNHVKNVTLNLCIVFEITLVVICKTECLIPTCITLIYYAYCQYCNSLWKRFKTDYSASDKNEISELEEYASYVLQIEDEVKLTNATLRSMLKSITNLVRKPEKNQPTNFIKFIEKSIGFNGVADKDCHRIQETQRYRADDSLHNFIAASSMYKINETILLHCNEQGNWPIDVEIFEWISTIIAYVLCACFTNLPHVIILKCHHEAMEKREDSIQTATQLLDSCTFIQGYSVIIGNDNIRDERVSLSCDSKDDHINGKALKFNRIDGLEFLRVYKHLFHLQIRLSILAVSTIRCVQ